MRIVCRGNTTAIHTHYELAVLGPSPFRMVLAPQRFWAPVVGGPEELQPVFEHEHLAVSPSGTRVGVRREDGGLSVIDVGTQVASRSTAHALTFMTDEVLLSLRPTDGMEPTLALHRGRHGAIPEQIALPDAIAVAWPDGEGRLWESDVPTASGTLTRDAAMFSNDHGHMVVDSEAGLIIRVGAADVEPTVHRVPSEGPHSAVTLTAYATAHGFLVAYSGGRGAGVVNHFAVNGRHLGTIAVSGNVSDICVVGFSAIFMRERADCSGDLELVIASLPALTIKEVVPTNVSPYQGYPGLDAREGGREVWVGNGVRAQTLVRSSRGWDARAVDLNLPLVTPSFVSARDASVTPAIADARPSAIGRDVVHPKFGVGRVVAQDGTGENAKLRIEFVDGVRTLLAKFVHDR
ncbi:MAG: hypothetical protein HOV81_25220 [Kofleriaceae bacterium]|nr:hypothetical protein [Kofleriaceae bacterium]